MFKMGLVSVSFRAHRPEEIIKAASAAGLGIIEWGSDVHLPPDDLSGADEIISLSQSHGIATPTYGSYFRIGETKKEDLPALFDMAERLGAKTVRIWGGRGFITPSDKKTWQALVKSAREIAAAAEARGICAALECHIGTVTESYEGALDFIKEVGSPALRSYWQPNQRLSHEENLKAARALAPEVDCIHVFNWDKDGKYPLALAKDKWIEYLSCFAPEAEKRDIPLLLEFMPDGRLESLEREAEALRDIVASL